MNKVTDITPPFLLEVQTDRFVDVMMALESAGFEVASKPGHSARYVLRDSEQQPEPPRAA
jgi:hypothetical protein